MGDMGFCTRLLGGKYGAPFTYAAFNKERGIAPGLPSFAELQQVYHYDKIERGYAGIRRPRRSGGAQPQPADPQPRRSARPDLNVVYIPFRVATPDVPTFLKEFDRVPVQGYSVTIPHKEAVGGAGRITRTKR